jgi:hypothetical protein
MNASSLALTVETVDEESRARGSRYLVALALVLAFGASVHAHRFVHNFRHHHWEDWRFFRHDHEFIHTLADCFTQPGAWPGLYRPLSTNLYYFWGRWAFGHRVEAYHAVNALVFVANGLLLFVIANRLLPSPWSYVPPAVFVSRLAHFQVLVQTTEIQALLSTLFALASIAWFVSGSPGALRDALSAFALALGLLSKESVVVVPAVLTVYGLLWGETRWRRHLVPWAVAALWAGAFVFVWRAAHPERTGFAYDVSWAIAGRSVAYLLSFFNLLVWPLDSAEMSSRVLAVSSWPWVRVAVVTLVAVAAALAVRYRAHGPGEGSASRAVALGLAWFVLGMAPFVILADRLFLRYTYFAHAGLSLAVTGAAWACFEALRAHR